MATLGPRMLDDVPQLTPNERLAEVTRLLAEGARLILQKHAAEQQQAEHPRDQIPEPAKTDANSRS